MKDWKQVVFDPEVKIIDVVKAITESGIQFAVMTNKSGQLTGVLTDGDIRRGILAGIDFSSPVYTIMNKSPKSVREDFTRKEKIAFLVKNEITFLPIIDESGKLIDVHDITSLQKSKRNLVPVVLMAGGTGSRLGKLTSDCPKPLLMVGNKPLLETIIENFIEQGFESFHLTLNYRSKMIMETIGDGSRWGVDIKYIVEEKKLGTAGALGLIALDNDEPVIVMNADLLTKVNFGSLLEFHKKQNSIATMCVRKYDLEVPYGVVNTTDGRVSEITEKPVHSFFVNAGVYVLSADLLKKIKKDEYTDMPSFLDSMIKEGLPVSAFPVHEYWIDIGRHEDLERANTDYLQFFN